MTTDTYTAPPAGWTCFHCGETFTTVGSARDHFGAAPTATPGCLLKVQLGAERGLLMALRKAEDLLASYMHEDTELTRFMYTQQGRHMYTQQCRHADALRTAEEAGYERGLQDYSQIELRLARALDLLRQAGNAIDGLVEVGATVGLKPSDITLTIRASVEAMLQGRELAALPAPASWTPSFLPQEATLQDLDAGLEAMQLKMLDYARQARITARKARRSGNKVKADKFHACARCYQIAARWVGYLGVEIPF